MRKRSKYIVAQIPVAAFAIWFLGWLVYTEVQLWTFIAPGVYMNILALLMVVFVFVSFEAARRSDKAKAEVVEAPSEPTVCPACHTPLAVTTKLQPFQIIYTCKKKDCPLAPQKPKRKGKSKK